MRTRQDRSKPVTTGNEPPAYADRSYRSASGVGGGVLLLGLAAWLGGDAIFEGHGRTPLIAIAGLLLAVPLIVAFTVRPVVYAGEERIRIRNPFRTITLGWESVDHIRAGYSTELFAGDEKFQLWAIPVSVRARKRAVREAERRNKEAEGDGSGSRPRLRIGATASSGATEPGRAWSDQALIELRELADGHPADEDAPRRPATVRWSYELLGAMGAGAVLLIIMLTIG